MDKPNSVQDKVFENQSESLETLRKISPLSFGIERAFYLLTRVSPERLFGPTRVQIQNKYSKTEERLLAAQNRGRRIETYLLIWLVIETIAILFGTPCKNRWVTLGFVILVCVRIADIIQITGNISLFDRLKINWRYYYIENTVETLKILSSAIWKPNLGPCS